MSGVLADNVDLLETDRVYDFGLVPEHKVPRNLEYLGVSNAMLNTRLGETPRGANQADGLFH